MPIRIDTIRLRLTLWYAAILAVALASMSVAAYTFLDRMAARHATGAILQTAGTVLATGGRRPGGLEAAVERFRAPDRRVLLVAPGGRVLAASTPPPFGPPAAREVFAGVPPPAALAATAHGGHPASRVVRLRPGDPPVRVGVRPLLRPEGAVLAVVASTRPEQLMREHARTALAFAVVATLLLAVVPGSLLVRRSLAPIGEMTRRASRIGAERLGDRLPVGNPRDELGALARVLNELLDRLQAAFAQQRRFMAEAAHELRTPVAVVRAETELALAGERTAAEYRDALGVVWSESERLARVVDDLLTLSRAQAGEYPLRRAPADLAEVVADVARAHRSLAAARGVRLETGTDDELPLDADAALLERMLRNLVENAVKHGRPGDTVRVEARRAGEVYRLRVADTGPGIPADSRERIWEPFFRGSLARAGSADGGAGLGLPLARWIAEAHGGSLELAATGPDGSVFEAVLPAAPVR